MSNISVDSVLQHKEIKNSFDKDFVSSFVGKIPEIMKLDNNELTLGHIASITDQSRASVGRFLQAASNMKNFPIGIVNRTPVIKKVKAGSKPKASTQKTAKVKDKAAGQQFDMSSVAKSIIDALRKDPVGSSDKRYASVETLADELNVPEDFVSKVIDNLRKRNIISLYDGENDFDEVVFYLNQDGFAKGAAQAKKAKSSKAATSTEKEAVKPVKAKTDKATPEKTVKPSAPKTDTDIDWLNMDVPKKTMNAVIQAMTDDKFTRNGILKEVAKKGVHQRNHVDAAFRQLVDNGTAVPTNDGGARNYFTITAKQDEVVQKPAQPATVEKEAVKATTPAPATSTATSAATSTDISTDSNVDQSIMNSLSALLNSASQSLQGGINTNEEIDVLLAKVKSAEHMLLAAKALK